MESGYDLISTIKYTQYQWFHDLDVEYSWVKGHPDRGNEEPNHGEMLNIEADELCDAIRMEATGLVTARDNCALWESEASALFIRRTKVMGKVKEQLQKQVHDSTLRKFLVEK
jgi:hypothetical protein